MDLKAAQYAMRKRQANGKKIKELRVKRVAIAGESLSEKEAGDRYRERQALAGRLRRYSSVSLLQRLQLKEQAVQYMGGKCQLCGYAKCMRALEFHHKERRVKEFSISNFINSAIFEHSLEEVWRKVEKELLKCTLLCSNCHREVESGVTVL